MTRKDSGRHWTSAFWHCAQPCRSHRASLWLRAPTLLIRPSTPLNPRQGPRGWTRPLKQTRPMDVNLFLLPHHSRTPPPPPNNTLLCQQLSSLPSKPLGTDRVTSDRRPPSSFVPFFSTFHPHDRRPCPSSQPRIDRSSSLSRPHRLGSCPIFTLSRNISV